MGVEWFVCCDTCKEYLDIDKIHYGDPDNFGVGQGLIDFLLKHRKHSIWLDHDHMDKPVFLLPEYNARPRR